MRLERCRWDDACGVRRDSDKLVPVERVDVLVGLLV